MNESKKFEALIPLWCEKVGQEYDEEEWAANKIDKLRIERIMDKSKQRRGEAVEALLRIIDKGEKAPTIVRAVRLSRAIDAVANRTGNFKGKVIAEEIGKVFYSKAAETVFKEFDPSEIVKLRKEGKI